MAELDRPADALREYEAALKTAPGRFNSLLGASRAAAKLGDREKSEAYLETLRKQAPKAERAGVSLR
jgi:uncharacterized protein HemY